MQTVPGAGLQLGGVQTQMQTMQVEQTQTLALELQSQPGEKKRRMACTCPNCKDTEKRWESVTYYGFVLIGVRSGRYG